MITFLQVSELIRQNKPVYAIDTADTETHFKRCFQSSMWLLLNSECLCRKIWNVWVNFNWLVFAKDSTGWKYPCLHGIGYV